MNGRGLAASALAVVAALAVLLAIVLLNGRKGESVASSSPSFTAVASATTLAVTGSPAPTASLLAPTASPQGAFTNAKFGYSIVLTQPYHLSSALTTTFDGAHPAAQDVFTVQTPEQEAAGSKNCETACPVWDYTLLVAIYTDAGSMTPRQWYDAGNVGFSTGSTLEDINISGRPALKITGSARFPVEYLVADGRGRMFDLAYTIRPDRSAPAGASRDKLEQMIASFTLLL
jgi:hypothetical protein